MAAKYKFCLKAILFHNATHLLFTIHTVISNSMTLFSATFNHRHSHLHVIHTIKANQIHMIS